MRKTLPLERALAGASVIAEAVAQVRAGAAVASTPPGTRTAVTTRRAVVVGREQLEPHRLDAFAAGAAEPDVLARRPASRPPLEDHAERHVEPDDDRHGRREGGVEATPAPRACAPSRGRSAAQPLPSRASRPRRRRRPSSGPAASSAPSASRRRPTSSPHSSVSQRNRAEARDRVDGDERAGLLRRGGERAHVADDSGRGLRTASRARRLAPPSSPVGRDVVGGRRLAPLVRDVLDLAAVGPRDVGPALAEVARGDRDDSVARRGQVRDRRLEARRPRGRVEAAPRPAVR